LLTWCHMILYTGALQFNDCLFADYVRYCIITNGIILGLLTCLRFTICCVYYLGSDDGKQINNCSNCLCYLESGFTILGLVYLIILAFTAYFTYSLDAAHDCYVYHLFLAFIWLQFTLLILFVLTFCVLLMGVRHCCCLEQQAVHIS